MIGNRVSFKLPIMEVPIQFNFHNSNSNFQTSK